MNYTLAAMGRWWSAVTNECAYSGGIFDSAYCTVTDDDGQATGAILVMARRKHTADFNANVITAPPAG